MRSAPGILLVAVFAVEVAVMMMGAPKCLDDWWYMFHLRDWFEAQGVDNPEYGGSIAAAGIPWDGLKATWIEHFYEDNARIGNMLAPVLMLFPKWVGSGLMSVAWIVAMAYSFRAAGVRMRNVTLVGVGVIMWGVFMPWSNGFVSQAYQLNYILPASVAMPLAYYLVVRRGRGLPVWGAALLGLAAGVGHEGFAIPFACGLVALAVCGRRWRTSATWAALGSMCVGIALLCFAPGTEHRAAGLLGYGFGRIASTLARVVAYSVPFLLMAVLFGCRLSTRKNFGCRLSTEKNFGCRLSTEKNFGCRLSTARNRLLLRGGGLVVFAIVNSLAVIAIMVATSAEPRVMWWAVMISTVGLMSMLRGCRFFAYGAPKTHVLALLPLLAFVYVQFGFADFYTLRMRSLLTGYVERWRKEPGQLFGEVLSCADFNVLSGKMPDVLMFNTNTIFIDMYYGAKAPHFAIVPRELEGVTPAAGRPVAGDAGLREYEGRLFRGADVPDGAPRLGNLEVDYGSGPSRRTVWIVPFVSRADGRPYEYVYVYTSWTNHHFGTLQNASL